MYNGGDFIQVTAKYTRSQILPYSLGFISHFETIDSILVHSYKAVFYRLGKTGQPRLVSAVIRVPLVEDDYVRKYCKNNGDAVINELLSLKSHSIKISKINLLKCSSEAFIAYLTAKIMELYHIGERFEAKYINKSIFYRDDPYTIQDFSIHVKDKDWSLVSHVGYDALIPYYTTFLTRCMNEKDFSQLKCDLLKRYDDVLFRKKELLDLNKLFARYSGVLIFQLNMEIAKIISLKNAVNDGVYITPNKDFVLKVLKSIPKWH